MIASYGRSHRAESEVTRRSRMRNLPESAPMHYINVSDLMSPGWTFLEPYHPDPALS